MKQLIQILKCCKDFDCFVFEGLLIRGDKVFITKKYIAENLSKSFYVWLIENNLVILEDYSKNSI